MTKRILKMALLAVVSLAVLPVAGQADEFKFNSKQKTKTDYVERKVIDTLEAINYFNASKKPVLLAKYQKNVEMQKRVEYLSQTNAKKVSSPEDLELMSKAYDAYRSTLPAKQRYKTNAKSQNLLSLSLGVLARVPYKPNYKVKEVYDKNVAKGKLTPKVRKYLQFYNEHLKESLRSELRMIDLGWSAWLEGDEIPYKIVIDTIVNVITEKDVWKYINDNKLDFVSEKTRDFAFEAPTSMLTGNKWLLIEDYINPAEYYIFKDTYVETLYTGLGSNLITGELIFRQDGTYSFLQSIEHVEEHTTWTVSHNGKWMRYKREYICIRPDASSLSIECAVYEGKAYPLLSERLKSNVDDIAKRYTKEIREKIVSSQTPTITNKYGKQIPNYDYIEFPNTKSAFKCERLDNFLILSGKKYISESKFQSILEHLSNGKTIEDKAPNYKITDEKTVEEKTPYIIVEDMPKYFNFK